MKTIDLLLFALVSLLLPDVGRAEDPEERLELLRQNEIATDTPGVIDYLRRLQLAPGTEDKDDGSKPR